MQREGGENGGWGDGEEGRRAGLVGGERGEGDNLSNAAQELHRGLGANTCLCRPAAPRTLPLTLKLGNLTICLAVGACTEMRRPSPRLSTLHA